METRPALATAFLMILFFLFTGSESAFSMDATETLPAGITSPAIRFGMVTGVDSKYNSDGTVQSLNEINTINFTSDQIAKLGGSEVNSLVTILNQFSQQNLGSQLNLGTLRVETEPDVRYIAPIFARGINEKFTLAVAMPIVFYQNDLRFNQSNSNVSAICDQIQGAQNNLNELRDACQKLNTKITDAAQNEIQKKGFKPVRSRKETVFGDIQLVGLWKFYERDIHSLMVRTSLTLPTGQKNDPDDLADIGAFGYRAIEPILIYNIMPIKSVRLSAKIGYKLMIPDHAVYRVPGSAGDVLPGPETKENLSRDIGDTITLGTAANYYFWKSFSIAGGYEYTQKGADSFSGEKNARYDLLAKDTRSTAHKLRAAFSYDTIDLYKRTKSIPPLKLDFEVSNTIAGTNSDRQLVNEVSLTMFF